MKSFKFLLLLISGSIWLCACSKSSEDTVGGGNPPPGGNPGNCVTTNMTYSGHIAPIIQANCFACHSNANANISGFSLEGYSNLKARVDDGRLLGAITHTSGFTPMPQGGSKLPDCTINRIKAWIEAGAPNN